MNDIKHYGVREQHRNEDKVGRRLEEIDRLGFTIIQSGFSEEKLASLRAATDAVYQRQVEEMGADFLARANDSDIARCPLAFNKDFLELAILPPIMEICRRIFGENYVLLQQNAIINRPHVEQYQTRWHRDLAYQHWTSSRKLIINALFCLDPWREDTGATWILPGSHLIESFPSDEFVSKHQVVAVAPAGSVLLLDSMMFHRAGHNRSKIVRRGINHLIGLPFMVQQINMPAILDGKYSDDPFLNRCLGYRWNPTADVASWRRLRLT